MTDTYETELAYEAVCKQRCTTSHPMIQQVLAIDKEENLIETKSFTSLYLAGNNKLISDKRLTDDDADMLRATLSHNSYVAGLDLRYNELTDVGAGHIAQLIRGSEFLQFVNLMCNNFGDEGAKHLAEALQSNQTLTTLRVNGNKIGNRGGLYFAQALQINETLESLDLADTDLTIESLIALATVLNYNQHLKALNVSRPILSGFQDDTTEHFARMLKVNQSLEELHLMKHSIRDSGATCLAENLIHNFTLTYLNLSCNRITRDGAKQLAAMLRHNTTLKILDLGFNRIGDDGATCIAEVLALCNCTLTTLCIVSNEVNGKGLCDIADCLRKKNQSLSEIYIWGNNLEESCCIAFKNLLDVGRLHPDKVDIRPYIVDGRVQLAEVSNGLRCWYYWGPAYGDYAQPELARFTERARSQLF